MHRRVNKLSGNDAAVILSLGLIQGLLTALSLEPHNVPVTGWLMPWPLFYFAGRFRGSVPRLIVSGFSCALFYNIFTFYWVMDLFANFADMGTAASAAAFIPFSIIFNLHIPAFILLFGISLRARFRRFLYPRWLTAGLIALFCDRCIPRLFPCRWGNFIAGNNYIAQMADVTGIFGLTFVLFAVSYFLYHMARITRLSTSGSAPLSAALKGLLRPFIWRRLWPMPFLLAVCLLYGIISMNRMLENQKSLPTVRVAIINPNAPPEDKARVNDRILHRLMFETIPGLVDRAAEAAGGTLDLVVLPESAVPFMCADDAPESRRLRRYSPDSELMVQMIAYNHNVDVFFNETIYKPGDVYSGNKKVSIYNSSALYSRDGRRRGSYHKRELLAFGEYMPGEGLLNSLGLGKIVRDLVGASRFTPGPASNLIAYSVRNREGSSIHVPPLSYDELRGTGPREFEKKFPADRRFSPSGYFLPLICYESLMSDHVRSFFNNPERRDPDFIVNITQDGWYGNTAETYQHFELARIRALETRRALVRSVNNGAAGFVDIAGRHVMPLAGPVMTGPGSAGFQVWDVPVNRGKKTFYVRYGDTWIFLPLLLLTILLVLRLACVFIKKKQGIGYPHRKL
jgi:apolipoprotein N-acyltransferase